MLLAFCRIWTSLPIWSPTTRTFSNFPRRVRVRTSSCCELTECRSSKWSGLARKSFQVSSVKTWQTVRAIMARVFDWARPKRTRCSDRCCGGHTFFEKFSLRCVPVFHQCFTTYFSPPFFSKNCSGPLLFLLPSFSTFTQTYLMKRHGRLLTLLRFIVRIFSKHEKSFTFCEMVAIFHG